MGKIINKDTVLGTIYQKLNNQGKVIQLYGAIGFIKEYKGYKHFVITNLLGKRNTDANYYLNIYLNEFDYKVREKAFSALKAFFSFIDLFSLQNKYRYGLNKEQVNSLKQFLKGGNRKGSIWDMEFNITRSNKTISIYLGVIRDFYTSILNISDSDLHRKTNVGIAYGDGLFGHTVKKKIEKYRSNPIVSKNKMVPKYISTDEYNEIIKLIEANYSLRDHIIIKLMYEQGLRIGEVLGLTLEDIQETEDDQIYRLVVRNRVSDKPWQRAKTCLSPTNVTDYADKAFQEIGTGYQVVYILSEMKEMLDEYIEDVIWNEHLLSKSKKKKDNLLNFSKADSVNGKENLYNLENYYIFLSKQLYSPLTQSGWNKVLRSILFKVGINLDTNVRKENLNHRFRHGFAMNKIAEGYDRFQVAKFLRHSNPDSVLVYYNPTEKDYIKLLKLQKEQTARD